DHDRHRDRVEKGPQFGQDIGLEIDHHMPAGREAARHFEKLVLRGVVHQPLEKVEADPADAALMQGFEFALRNLRIDHSDAAGLAVRFRYGIERGRIVPAVAARLHDHIAGETEMVAQSKQHVRPGIGGNIFRPLAEGKLGHRPEYVAMRIHRAGRRREARLGWAGMPADDAVLNCLFAHTKTVPSISLRAVRSRAAVSTSPASFTSRTQLISPVGCSTDSVLRLPSGICATSAAGDPSIMQAVATLTAAS